MGAVLKGLSRTRWFSRTNPLPALCTFPTYPSTRTAAILSPNVADPVHKGGRETFTFFVTDTQHSKAMLALSLMYRPLQSPPGPPPRRAHGATEAIGAGAAAPSGYRPGDVVIGEGFVDLLGVFPVHNGTYTPGRHKGNSRRVAVPIREPMGKRWVQDRLVVKDAD